MNAFIQNPSTAADYAANLRAARVAVAGPLGLALSTGSPAEFSALSQADQIRVTDELATFIVSNQGLFSALQVETARRRTAQQSFRTPVESSPGLLDQAETFVRAYGQTFGETVEAAGGITGRTLDKIGIPLGTIGITVGVVAVLWFGAPFVLPKLRDAWSKKK